MGLRLAGAFFGGALLLLDEDDELLLLELDELLEEEESSFSFFLGLETADRSPKMADGEKLRLFDLASEVRFAG